MGLVVGAVAIIALVIWGVRFSMASIQSHTTPTNPVDDMQPVPCDSSMMTATVTQSGDAAGYPVNFGLSIVNDKGTKACYLDTGNDTFKMTITSGDQTIYDSQACQAGPENKRLLLDVDLSASQSFYWNGKDSGPNCEGTTDAQPGTYVARFYNGDAELLDRGYVFNLATLGSTDPSPSVTVEPTEAPTTPEPSPRGVATNEPTETPEPTDIGSPTVDPSADPSATGEPIDPFGESSGGGAGSDLTEP